VGVLETNKGGLSATTCLHQGGICMALCLLVGLLFVVGRAVAEEPKKNPVTVNADKLDYDRTNDIYTAEGHVKVEQDGMRVEADKLVLNNKTGEASAEGNVYLQEKGDVIRADKLQLNVMTKAGVIYQGDLFMSKDNLHVKGERIERRSENVYHVENGTFTTCDAREWYFRADEMDVDMDRYATGSGVSFNMAGLPVFYAPYLLFPVRRQSGLLIPELEYRSGQGFIMRNAVFWAISDYQDMTFYSDYRSRQGLGTAVEYRYNISTDSGGKLFYNYFDTFPQYHVEGTPESLWYVSYQHHEEIAADLSIRADINVVSYYTYFRELDRRLELTSQPYLDSNLFYVERWNTTSLNLLGQYTIDLTQQDNGQTVQKLPELRYTIYEEKLFGPVHVNFDGTATNFTRSEGGNVMRADFNPRLSASFGSEGINLTPRLGFRATYYDRSVVSNPTTTVSGPVSLSSEPTERTFYYAGADLNARVSRVYGADGDEGFGRIRHSIEPTFSYSYIPKLDTVDIPQLDSVDTVTSQNLLAISLINRLTAHYKQGPSYRTFDVMVFRLTESYNFHTANTQDQQEAIQRRSLLQAEITVKTPKLLTFSAIENYDTYNRVSTSSSESITLSTSTLRFNLSRQYLHQPTTRYLITGGGATLGKWDIDVQFWRDIETKTTTQQEYKVHYKSQCWGVGVMYLEKPGEKNYLLTLDLKGLGALKF
jgi:LPS-assembly protein